MRGGGSVEDQEFGFKRVKSGTAVLVSYCSITNCPKLSGWKTLSIFYLLFYESENWVPFSWVLSGARSLEVAVKLSLGLWSHLKTRLRLITASQHTPWV